MIQFSIILDCMHLLPSDLNSFYKLTKSSIKNIRVNINFAPDVPVYLLPPSRATLLMSFNKASRLIDFLITA